nr:unnamed protein product [Digitaria exilis]
MARGGKYPPNPSSPLSLSSFPIPRRRRSLLAKRAAWLTLSPLPSPGRRYSFFKALVVLLYVQPAGDSALFLSLASTWLDTMGTAATDLGRTACGSDCVVPIAGAKIRFVSRFALAAIFVPALLVFAHLVAVDVSTCDAEGPSLFRSHPIPMSLYALRSRPSKAAIVWWPSNPYSVSLLSDLDAS